MLLRSLVRPETLEARGAPDKRDMSIFSVYVSSVVLKPSYALVYVSQTVNVCECGKVQTILNLCKLNMLLPFMRATAYTYMQSGGSRGLTGWTRDDNNPDW